MVKMSLVLFIFLVISGCSEKTSPQLPLKIAVLTNFPGHNYAFIAQEKKLFAQQGVTVELVPHSSQPSASDDYEKGRVDGLFVPFTDAIVFNAQGIPTVVVYCTDYSETADLIVGRPELNNLSELKGKTISFEGFNTFSHLFVVTLLEQAGINEGEYKAVNLQSSQVLAALKAGKIDAGHIYEPDSSHTITEGFKILASAGDIPNIITDVLVFRADVVKNRAKEIQGVVSALVEAREFIETHPTEAFTIIAQVATTSATEAETSFKTLHALRLADNIKAFQSGGALFTVGQQIIDFYQAKGQLVQKISLDEIINGQFVTTVRGKP
jgi:NitT/TauT family transport system substrate-binding protein